MGSSPEVAPPPRLIDLEAATNTQREWNFATMWQAACDAGLMSEAERDAYEAAAAVLQAGVIVDVDDRGRAVPWGTLTRDGGDDFAPVQSVTQAEIDRAVAFVDRQAAPYRRELRQHQRPTVVVASAPVRTNGAQARPRERRAHRASTPARAPDDPDLEPPPPSRREGVVA